MPDNNPDYDLSDSSESDKKAQQQNVPHDVEVGEAPNEPAPVEPPEAA